MRRHPHTRHRSKPPPAPGPGSCQPTWFPPYGPLLPAAEANFAEDAEDVPLAQRAGVFAGAGATLVGGDLVAVGLAGLTFLTDQGAGDGRRHLPERRTEPPKTKRPPRRMPRHQDPESCHRKTATSSKKSGICQSGKLKEREAPFQSFHTFTNFSPCYTIVFVQANKP